MGINDVTTWAKKRLAEGAGLSAPTVSGQHGAGTAPAPAQPSIEAAPAPQKAVSHWCDVDQPLHASEVTDQVPPTPALPTPSAASPARPPAPAPMGWLHVDQPWRVADRLYQNHHWQCPACMAAARAAPGSMARCAEGQLLHDAYVASSAAT